MKLSALSDNDGRMHGISLLPENEPEAFVLEHLASLCGANSPLVVNGDHHAVQCILQIGRHRFASGDNLNMNAMLLGAQIVPIDPKHPACEIQPTTTRADRVITPMSNAALFIDVQALVGHPDHNALILFASRPLMARVVANQSRSMAELGGKYNEHKTSWTFPSGARIEFGVADSQETAQNYDGVSANWLGFYCLEQFDGSVIERLTSRARRNGTLSPVIRSCSANDA